jgi:hypothetical protein
MLLCWHYSLHGTMLFLFPLWSCKGGKDLFIVVVQVWILALEGTALHAVIISDMMICIDPFATAWARARTVAWTRRRLWQGMTLFSGQSVCTRRRGVVVVHNLPPFSWSDCVCSHLSSHRTFSWSPALCGKGDCCIDCLNGGYGIGMCCNPVGCFVGSHGSCNNDASGLSHGCEQQRDELSSSPLAVSSLWACQGHQPLCWQSGTAQKRPQAKEDPGAPFHFFPGT